MPRPRTHTSAPRTKTVTIRLTEAEHLRRSIDARKAGLTVSGLCERLVCEGTVALPDRPTFHALDPALFAELRRIGNNANQIAHALNSNLPPDTAFAWRTVNELLVTLMRDEMLAQKIETLRTRPAANDPPHSQTRDVFQRSVQLHPARPGEGNQ